MTKRAVSLDELIRSVHNSDPEGTPLTQLSHAVIVSQQLDEVADHLVGHFVDQARRAGSSWTEIGQSMGVTKQAAQKRFVPSGSGQPVSVQDGFARFDDQARKAVVGSQSEARAASAGNITPEHLLLGLVRDPHNPACEAMKELGLTPESVRAVLPPLAPEHQVETPPELIPYTPAAKKVLELTIREALRLDHDQIGTEHLLLGLVADDQTELALTLAGLGLTRAYVETWIARTGQG